MSRSLLVLCILGVAACSNSASNSATLDGGATRNPDPPAIKPTEIDRAGRAVVNVMLTAPFASDTDKGLKQDAYNSTSTPSQWSTFQPDIAANQAIFDSFDAVCGNQFLAGPTATAGRYDALASVLTNDVLAVNSASGTCTTYLGVEANATGLLSNTDCGGRTPLYDTIDVTYSILMIGQLSGVTDGIDKAGDGTASTTDFPFLATPNQ